MKRSRDGETAPGGRRLLVRTEKQMLAPRKARPTRTPGPMTGNDGQGLVAFLALGIPTSYIEDLVHFGVFVLICVDWPCDFCDNCS